MAQTRQHPKQTSHACGLHAQCCGNHAATHGIRAGEPHGFHNAKNADPLGLAWNPCIDLGSPNCVGAAQLPITAVYHLSHHLWCIAGWLEWVMDKPGLQIVPTVVPLTYARCSHQHRGAEHTHAHPYKPEREPCMHVAVATSRVRTVAWTPQRFSRIPCFWA